MRSAWTLARIDLAVWRRIPWVIAAALIIPFATFFLVLKFIQAPSP